MPEPTTHPQDDTPRDAMGERLGRPVAVGVSPAPADAPEARPWPVVLLTALGAWLAAIPLLIMVGMLLGDVLSRSIGPYLVGLLVLGAAVVVLRSRSLPLFVEQLAVPALLVGGGSLAFGVFRDLPERAGALLLAAIALALVVAVPRAWLRVLLGALMAGLIGFAVIGPRGYLFGRHGIDAGWLAAHVLVIAWVAWVGWLSQGLSAAKRSLSGEASHDIVEPTAAGWVLVTLVGLAWLAGMSFMVGGSVGGGLGGEVVREVAGHPSRQGLALTAVPLVSALLAALACGWVARAWPLLRQPALGVVALIAIAAGWMLPTLGAAMLVLALAATTLRWRVAAAAAVAAVWIVGSFYYLLVWPLATKALALVAAGAVLGVLAWWLMWWPTRRGAGAPAQASVSVAAQPIRTRAAAWVALSTLASLAVAAGAIWQKEDVIAHGQAVFVDLAPVDPRSLMQGDYMRLNFRVPSGVRGSDAPALRGARPHLVARRDARGVASQMRVDEPGVPLAPEEFRIELSPKDGRWVLVTDAWFFREGEGERWARARYGEFRVAADGRALLVGMADADLQPILP